VIGNFALVLRIFFRERFADLPAIQVLLFPYSLISFSVGGFGFSFRSLRDFFFLAEGIGGFEGCLLSGAISAVSGGLRRVMLWTDSGSR